jgi:hypothetical protein
VALKHPLADCLSGLRHAQLQVSRHFRRGVIHYLTPFTLTVPTTARRLKDPCKEIPNSREKVGHFAVDTAGSILEITDRVLGRAFDLVGLAARSPPN